MAERVAGPVPRADRKRFEESGYVRTSDPRVAEHVAGAIAKNLLDTEAAVRELKPELDSYEVSQVAAKLDRDPNVTVAVQKELKKLGLDEKSKTHYIRILWQYAQSVLPEDEKLKLTSLRLLARVFLPEQQASLEKPEELKISGSRDFERGIERMGLGDDIVGKLSSTNLAATIDDEDNESASFDA